MQYVEVTSLENLSSEFSNEVVIRLLPCTNNSDFYYERTNRNIGWITNAEQGHLRGATVGIAGTGGMGGLLAATFVRLGVGEIRIADSEVFDLSNLNRQFAATRESIGHSKALETAKLMRSIADDTTIVIYPAGISETSAPSFVEGCDIICDEIEFWALGSRIQLHQAARGANVSLFNCNTVGFATHLFLFTPDGITIEEMFGLTKEEAEFLQLRVQNGTASPEEIEKCLDIMLTTLVPNLPEYCSDAESYSTHRAVRSRLLETQQASIIASNPPLATGFLADRVLLYLIKDSLTKRILTDVPNPPGYLYFDAAKFESRYVKL